MFPRGYVIGSVANELARGAKKSREQVTSQNDRLAALFSPELDKPPKKPRLLLSTSHKEFTDKLADQSQFCIEQNNTISSDDEDSEIVGDQLVDRTVARKHRKWKKATDPSAAHKTLFVGNLPKTIKKKHLHKMFRAYGTILSVRIRSLVRAKKGFPEFIEGKLDKKQYSVNAYIHFENEQSVKDALTLNGTLVGDHHVRVDTVISDKKHDNERTVFIGNLPFDANDELLRRHFMSCGEIGYVRVVRCKLTGAGKGFAYIEFKDKANIVAALKLNQSEFQGRQLRVTRCKNNKVNGTTDKQSASKPASDVKSIGDKKINSKRLAEKRAKRRQRNIDSYPAALERLKDRQSAMSEVKEDPTTPTQSKPEKRIITEKEKRKLHDQRRKKNRKRAHARKAKSTGQKDSVMMKIC